MTDSYDYDIGKDLGHVKRLSSFIEKRISSFDDSDKKKITMLTPEELQDLNQVVNSVHFVLCKYEDKKEMRSLLGLLVNMLDNLSSPLSSIDDEIKELVFSAEDKITNLKNMNCTISETFTLEEMPEKNEIKPVSCLEKKNCPNNFTKPSSQVYPQDYLEKSAV